MMAQALKMAWKAISSNKMRSFLTMLGIIIGVMALVVLVSIVNATTTSVTGTIANMGSDYLTVTVSDDKGNPLRLADVAALADEEQIGSAAPMATITASAANSLNEEDATVYGTTGAYAEIGGLELASGRWLNATDVENHTYVAVINAGLAQAVMGRMDVVGETIALDGINCLVVGVLAADESDSSTTETYEAYVAYTTLVRLSDSVPSTISTFFVSSAEGESLDSAEQAVESVLLARFAEDSDAFTVINQSTIADAVESVTNTLAFMLGGIAAISLLVGGIGIMNIMLVSVTERTREIGIRKAIGASRGTIMLQFLIEALVLSLMGCAIGVALSWITLVVVSALSEGVNYAISWGVVAVAAGFSLAIGVVFGLYPANKAAKMKPIDALRYTG